MPLAPPRCSATYMPRARRGNGQGLARFSLTQKRDAIGRLSFGICAVFIGLPLSPSLSPLLRRGEREKNLVIQSVMSPRCRVRGPGLQRLVGRVPSRGATFDVVYRRRSRHFVFRLEVKFICLEVWRFR